MKKIVRQLAKRGVLALALMSLCSLNVFAQVAHTHNQAEQNSVSNSDLQNDLVKVVRESTARFQDVKVAESASALRSKSTFVPLRRGNEGNNVPVPVIPAESEYLRCNSPSLSQG